MVEVASGGAEHDWIKYEKVKEYTNAFVILNDQKVGTCTQPPRIRVCTT